MKFTANIRYLSVLQNLGYPAALTTFGIISNAYILGGQIKQVEHDLGALIDKVERHLGARIDKIDHKITDLIRRQTEFEIQDMARVQKLVMDCADKK